MSRMPSATVSLKQENGTTTVNCNMRILMFLAQKSSTPKSPGWLNPKTNTRNCVNEKRPWAKRKATWHKWFVANRETRNKRKRRRPEPDQRRWPEQFAQVFQIR